MVRTGSAPTRARQLRDTLRTELLAGRFQPGERLPVNVLAERFEVSVTVAREALTVLSADGLVTSEPQQGFRVVDLSVEHLMDLTSVRVDIECLALRRAVREADLQWESAALAAHHTLASTPLFEADGQGVSHHWSLAHSVFHRALVQGCGSSILLELRDRLWDASTLYRSWSATIDKVYVRDVAVEHRELLDAVLARDADRAAALQATHIRKTTDSILAALRVHTDEDANRDPLGPAF
ncbi:GntR family transcriptional regulator [Nocardia sp. NPDC004750]